MCWEQATWWVVVTRQPPVVTENAVISSLFGKRFLFGKYSSMIYIEHIFTYHAASIKILLLPAHQHVTSLFPKQATCSFRGKSWNMKKEHVKATCKPLCIWNFPPSNYINNLFSGKSMVGFDETSFLGERFPFSGPIFQGQTWLFVSGSRVFFP